MKANKLTKVTINMNMATGIGSVRFSRTNNGHIRTLNTDRFNVNRLYNAINNMLSRDSIELQSIQYVHEITTTIFTPVDRFAITHLTRADLIDRGFDVSNVDDQTMQYLANKMGDAYVEYGDYWDTLEYFAENRFNIPRDPNWKDESEEDDSYWGEF